MCAGSTMTDASPANSECRVAGMQGNRAASSSVFVFIGGNGLVIDSGHTVLPVERHGIG